jgi:hypothetical protein
MRACLLLLILLWPALASAQYDRPGSASAQFLRLGVGPRAIAMGDAAIGSRLGAEATVYNPAALGGLRGTHAAATHTALFAGINHDFVAATHHLGNWGTVGLSLTALYTDAMEVRTPLQPDGTGETFRTTSLKAGLSYARQLTDQVSFGGTVGYVSEVLYEGFSASAATLDLAVLYRTDLRGFTFGMMMSNFGSNLQFVNEDYPLPTAFTFGASVEAFRAGAMVVEVSGAAVKPNDGAPLGQLGAEWTYGDLLSLRAGYRPQHDTNTLSFGGGVALDVGPSRLSADYAYSAYGELGVAHTFGVGVSF